MPARMRDRRAGPPTARIAREDAWEGRHDIRKNEPRARPASDGAWPLAAGARKYLRLSVATGVSEFVECQSAQRELARIGSK